MTLNGKEIELTATSLFVETFTDAIPKLTAIAEKSLKKKAVDMLVFDGNGDKLTVRCAGYPLNNPDAEKPDETTVVYDGKNTVGEFKFWLKIDDYGTKYVGTFLFPEEY